MAYLVRGEHNEPEVRRYLAEGLEFSWQIHDSGVLNWEDEPGYVQWAGWAEGVQIECSSEQFLGRAFSPEERELLDDLGFQPPEEGQPNFWRRVSDFAALGQAVDALATCLFRLLTPPEAVELATPPNASTDWSGEVTPEPIAMHAQVLTVVPVAKVAPQTVVELARAVAQPIDGPVAVVDAYSPRGCFRDELSAEWLRLGFDDLMTGVPEPGRTARLLVSGWPAADAYEVDELNGAALVAAQIPRLTAAGWTVVLIGPALFEHTLWLYEKVGQPLTDTWLLAASEFDAEWRRELVRDFVVGCNLPRAGRRSLGVLVGGAREMGTWCLSTLDEVHEPELSLTPETAVRIADWLRQQESRAPAEGWDSPLREAELDVPAVMLRISQLWYPEIDAESLYEATRGWWVMGPKRERAEYAFAVAGGVIRAAYRVYGWRPRLTPEGQTRWGFDGEVADELSHLVGLDVRSYFPQGAANPVRYVNCDSPMESRVVAANDAIAITSEPNTLAVIQTATAQLRANPVFHMGLGAKELFHSNLLAWLLESHPAAADDIVAEWAAADAAPRTLVVRRESHHLDLIIEVPGRAPVVIENKIFSLPDEEQLDAYAEHNMQAAGVPQAARILLSLTDPGWPQGQYNGWRWTSYSTLVERVRVALKSEPHPDPFAGELVERWADVVEHLGSLVEATTPVTDEEPLLLDVEVVEELRATRLHDSMQKARTRQVRHRLEQVYAANGLDYDFIESNFTKGAPLLGTAIDLSDGSRIGWQLQGSQFRRFLIAPSELHGSSARRRQERVEYALTNHGAWFDFEAEHEHGPFQPAPTAALKHFAPGFVYDYIKVPGITVAQVLALGTTTLHNAITYRDRPGAR